MIIKNYDVQKVGEFLLNLTLKGKQTRMRSRFINMLQEHLNQINDEKQQLFEDYSVKDEDGQPVQKTIDGKSGFKVSDQYQKELAILMSEEFILEEDKKVLDMLLTLQEVIFGLEDMEMSGDEAMTYNIIYDLFEDIGQELE